MAPESVVTTEERQGASGWAWAGYIAAVLAPILGIVLAIPLVVRAEYRHAGGVLLTVVASFLIHLAILSGGGY
jgi:hypothetical protein